MRIEIFCDGSCEPVNPGGTARYGVLVIVDGLIFARLSGLIGTGPLMSNNVAEYQAVVEALEFCKKLNWQDEEILVSTDSRLVVNQMSGLYGTNKASGLYVPYLRVAQRLSKSFSRLEFTWIPRELNEEADALSKALI